MDETLYQLRAPNGKPILGTYDLIPGRANVSGWTLDASGALVPEWEGGTDVFWDGQETQKQDGEDVVLDDEGNEHKLSECVLLTPGGRPSRKRFVAKTASAPAPDELRKVVAELLDIYFDGTDAFMSDDVAETWARAKKLVEAGA